MKIRIINPNILENGVPIYVDFLDEMLFKLYQDSISTKHPDEFVSAIRDHQFTDIKVGRVLQLDMSLIGNMVGFDTYNVTQSSIVDNSIYRGTYHENREITIPFELPSHQHTITDSSERELDRVLFHEDNKSLYIEIYRTNVLDGLNTKRYYLRDVVVSDRRARDSVTLIALDPRIYADTGGIIKSYSSNKLLANNSIPSTIGKQIAWQFPSSFYQQPNTTAKGYYMLSESTNVKMINDNLPDGIYYKVLEYENKGDFRYIPSLKFTFYSSARYVNVGDIQVTMNFNKGDILYIDFNRKLFLLNGISIISSVDNSLLDNSQLVKPGEKVSFDFDCDGDCTLEYSNESPILSISQEVSRIC